MLNSQSKFYWCQPVKVIFCLASFENNYLEQPLPKRALPIPRDPRQALKGFADTFL
jgi:hypothetical protein